ncbi:MAG: glycosyl hydrolase [Bacteroidales bacterium]|nr:glycosyl hydrolase [Bacteroidales bacterium]
MKTPIIKLLVILFLVSCSSKKEPESVSPVNSCSMLKSLFADPPSEYRSAPLWNWNEEITKEGISFQMGEFKKAGIGGVFVHPRPGLLNEYLSDEWFQLFDFTVQKGRELDMKVWIYDENSYPSGFAGGHVPAQMPDSYQNGTGLKMEVQNELQVLPSDTIEVILKKNETGFTDVTALYEQEMGHQGTYYVFRKTYPSRSPWYGGFTYVDLLHEGVTEKFLEITMTRGYERNKADFGTTVLGVFTDEPNLEAALSHGSLIRWTPGLWDAFRERWGYDLKIHLPSLVDETGNWKKVRHDYYELILELFIERWAKPWSTYCDDNGLKWTGHYWEHGWPVPTDGLDEAAFYIWHQQPGIDMLGNQMLPQGLGGQFGNDRAVRELRSAANQAGRIRTLSETYGGGGWEMSFEKQKRLLDWQCVLGVNFVNQHLSYYSLNGVRKFDYPPSFSYHEPWWKHYKLMGDYIGRISLAMSSGQQINKTLVLQPNTSAWMYFSRKGNNPTIDTIQNGFKHFVYLLEQHHLEYDLGSEYVLKTLGAVQGDRLCLGQRSYSLVVIPAEMENIDAGTFRLLDAYMAEGGKVLSFRQDIPYLDGEKSPRVNELAASYPGQWTVVENLSEQAVLNMLANPEFEMKDITSSGMLYHQRRILDDGQVLFVVNSHPDNRASAEVSLQGNHVTLLDLLTGEVANYPAQVRNGCLTFSFDLAPAGSKLFAITAEPLTDKKFVPSSKNGSQMKCTGDLQVKRLSDNVLVVNYLDLETADTDRKELYFMEALNLLFRENGIDMGNPWQHKIQYRRNYLDLDSLFTPESWFNATYHFTIRENLDFNAMQNIRAVVERPELWTVYLNGQEVEKIPGEHWIDKAFPLFHVGPFLQYGENTLTLKAPRMNILAEVMPVYLLGDFLVEPEEKGFEISGGEISGTGSWQDAGLPFYSQEISYSLNFNVGDLSGSTYKVQLGDWKGSLAEVLVNGVKAGLIAWQLGELDVTEWMKPGTNMITVNVTGSLKNTFGFFYEDNDSWIFGPFSWNSAPAKIPPASDYYLMDYGLFEPFKLIRTNNPDK